ncbi:hypothetical protein ACFL2V_02370 [Pseudomonadota bacterium]
MIRKAYIHKGVSSQSDRSVALKCLTPVFYGLKTVLLCALFVAVNSVAMAAAPVSNPASKEAQQLWTHLLDIQSSLQQRMEGKHQPLSVHAILNSDCYLPSNERMDAELLRTLARDLEHDKGLEFRAAYTTGDMRTDVGDANAYVELSWKVLRDGYYDNRDRARHMHRKADYSSMAGDINQASLESRCRSFQLTKQFAGMQAELLSLKLSLMEPVYEVERRAYLKGWSYLDDYLVSEEALTLTQHQLAFLRSAPYFDQTQVVINNPPLIDVDIRKIVSAIQDDDRQHNLNQLEQDLVRDKSSRRLRNNLRLFLRKELDVGNGTDADGVVAGVRFQMPLSKVSRRSYELESQGVDAGQAMAQWQRVSKVHEAYTQLQEQQQRTIKQHYRYQRAHERLRQTLVQNRLGDEGLLPLAVTRMRTLLDASLELIAAKEEVYRRVNRIFRVANVEHTADWVTPLTLEQGLNRARVGERAVYIWSRAFNETPNRHIIDFLEAKQIERVLISASSQVYRSKLNAFIEQTTGDIVTEIIIGSNEWVYPANHDRAALAIAAAIEATSAVHLDIEPQVFDDYREHSDRYLKDYITLLKKVRSMLDEGQKLSVAAPLHWPAFAYSEIAELVDTVYLMAYGKTSTQRRQERIAAVQALMPADKVAVALRTGDYLDEWQMENMFDALYTKNNISQFAIHQFKTFVRQAEGKVNQNGGTR